MATTTATISVKRAWWVMPYLYGVQLFVETTGMEPDMDKVGAIVMRGLTVAIK